jgi:exonuclease VII small subunit
MELVREGVINEMSIGYETIKEGYDRNQNVRYLTEIKLYEISLVTLAANPLAQITNFKNQSKKLDTNIDKLLKEFKSGRVLSKSNVNKLKEVISMLQDIIGEDSEEEDPEVEPIEFTQCNPEKPDMKNEDFAKILEAIKKHKK